jgi:ABC-type nitrate/sulfonate/bicarbonate transport system ATPase subunit
MAALALRVDAGTKTFDRGRDHHVAFRDVDLEVQRGEILALLGPSGCGKSTLLRSIAGLEQLDAGGVTLGDELDPDHAVGIAFQQPSLLPWLTVRGNVGLGLRFGANRARDVPDVVDRALDDLGLIEVADAFPDELSGGQAQRANVARLVVTGRPILLLDEPFAALDPATRSGLQEWLVGLQRSRGLTVVVVTHDVSEALCLGDRVALMTGAPGAVQRIWNVGEAAGAIRNPVVLERLRHEILDHYDTDQPPQRVQPTPWPTSDVIELEGAPT